MKWHALPIWPITREIPPMVQQHIEHQNIEHKTGLPTWYIHTFRRSALEGGEMYTRSCCAPRSDLQNAQVAVNMRFAGVEQKRIEAQ